MYNYWLNLIDKREKNTKTEVQIVKSSTTKGTGESSLYYTRDRLYSRFSMSSE